MCGNNNNNNNNNNNEQSSALNQALVFLCRYAAADAGNQLLIFCTFQRVGNCPPLLPRANMSHKLTLSSLFVSPVFDDYCA